jgi:hypothetical protein
MGGSCLTVVADEELATVTATTPEMKPIVLIILLSCVLPDDIAAEQSAKADAKATG